jgi:nucleoside-diphosphate-sugar epimerase
MWMILRVRPSSIVGTGYSIRTILRTLAECFVLATERGASGLIASVVDDEPTTYQELFTYIALLDGAAVPAAGGESHFPSFRVANFKAREILGWRPFYHSYRSGLA